MQLRLPFMQCDTWEQALATDSCPSCLGLGTVTDFIRGVRPCVVCMGTGRDGGEYPLTDLRRRFLALRYAANEQARNDPILKVHERND